MSTYTEAEAVARDFREALEDMQSFANRIEISNLTLIARENTEHALAISGALQEHIKRVAPQKKLTSMYVLDSIAKNVGTPYTLFFGRKLYQTFMDAYAMVDMGTRKKMDEMLKTWKEPVPGSIDTRPVFPLDVTRPIENALIKARTTALQVQQQSMRGQQQLFGRGGRSTIQDMPYRDTATPPGSRSTPQPHGHHQGQTSNTNGTSYSQPSQPPSANYPARPGNQVPSTPTSLPASSNAFYAPPVGGYGMSQDSISTDALNNDIQRLIAASNAQMAQTPYDQSIQTRVKDLMDLQTILQTQNLPQDRLMLVKNQISDLAVTMRAPPAQTSTPIPQTHSVAVAPPPPPAAAASKVSLDSLFGPGALAALMARNSAPPQIPTQPAPAVVAIKSPPPQRPELQKLTAPPATDPTALMNMLRQAGMLGSAPPSVSTTPAPNTAPPLPFALPIPLPSMNAGIRASQPTTIENLTADIVMKSSSLKQFRPHLVPFLFQAQGPQCTQCGRRFRTDEEGKKKKTAHMDWHFRVNQRITEAEKRGQHRSWLVDEMDWINTRETIDQDNVAPLGGFNTAQSGSVAKEPKLQYILVPDDPLLANSVCPICQEKFETRWLDGAQEFVWPDAIKVGERIYHASCHREATKDEGNTPMFSRGTPEPVLGKRKAEDELTSMRGKMKVEAA